MALAYYTIWSCPKVHSFSIQICGVTWCTVPSNEILHHTPVFWVHCTWTIPLDDREAHLVAPYPKNEITQNETQFSNIFPLDTTYLLTGYNFLLQQMHRKTVLTVVSFNTWAGRYQICTKRGCCFRLGLCVNCICACVKEPVIRYRQIMSKANHLLFL